MLTVGAPGGPDGTTSPQALDVIVLAGGTARRLGGVRKPDVVARGARLIDHVLAGLEGLRPALALGRVVVVAPQEVALPDGVLRALEDPPLGGPVAGVGAGLLALRQAGPAPVTALLTCDAPEAWRALPPLAARLAQEPRAAGAVNADGEHRQYLVGVYRSAALGEAVAPQGVPLRDVAVRRTLGALAPLEVDLGALRTAGRDLDTWQEVAAWERGG